MKRVFALLLALGVGAAFAQSDTGNGYIPPQTVAPKDGATAPAAAQQWSVWGGEVWFAWNRDLLGDLGMTLSAPKSLIGTTVSGRERFALRETTGLDFDVAAGNFAGFRQGSVSMQGGYVLHAGKQSFSLQNLRLAARKNDPLVLDLVGEDGRAWFYIDNIMYAIEKAGSTLDLHAMDLRMTPEFAALIGKPDFAGYTVAGMRMQSKVFRGNGGVSLAGWMAGSEKGGSCTGSSKWPGDPTPTGGTYQADVFMKSFSMVYKRNSGADGPGGADGKVVYTPSSTLRNNVNTTKTTTGNPGNANVYPTIPGDPLGTSVAIDAADVVWRTKFFSNCEPYDNDQHPYLIWNLYRIDGLGRIEQVARSGVKHAFLTVNSQCIDAPGSSYILGRGCSDTYADSNNDSGDDLGPRREILPAKGLWGRCGSIYDLNCNGNDEDFAGYSNFDHRLQVNETAIDPALNTGASYRFESWYIVRDDINIYNTMQTRTATFAWNGSTWGVTNGSTGDMLLGPAIDRWVPAGSTAANQRNSEIADSNGHSKVAVKVTDLGGGQYRYDYAVMNFDFAVPVTQGAEPNLRVLSNDGFTAFSLPISSALNVTNIEFGDGDNVAANNWTSAHDTNRLTWTAPAGNRLNWGTLFRFSFTTNAAPIDAPVMLTTANATTEVLQTGSLVPQSEAVVTYAVGGDLAGLHAGESVSLKLNNGAALVLSADGAFVFANEVIDGGTYAVTVSAQPPSQNCTVANGSGTVSGADITDVTVTCVDLPPPSYTVGGATSGLTGTRSVTLQINGGETAVRTGSGSFTFPTPLVNQSPYVVTITQQPADRDCTVSNGSGTVNGANVTNVQVACALRPLYSVGGTVSGLSAGTSVSLQLNGGTPLQQFGNSPFTFPGTLESGAAYSVVVSTQPQDRFCTVANGSGTIGTANVTNVTVTCSVVATYSVGGTIAGLMPNHTVSLQLNGGTATSLGINGAFNFPQELPAGTAYAVTVGTQPAGQTCTVTGGTGTMPANDITSVAVQCGTVVTPGEMFDDGFE